VAVHLSHELRGTALIVRVGGEIDHAVAEEVRDYLDTWLRRSGARHLVLNLSDLEFMDSSGLGVILGRYRRLAPDGGRIVVCGVNSTVHRMFELSGLYRIVSAAADEDAALAELGVA